MAKVCLDDLDLPGKRVLVRVDFNVPLDERREVGDDTRIQGALPTIRFAAERGAVVLLLSHLGRPRGKPDPAFSLAPVARRLGELLGRPVPLAPDCVGEAVGRLVQGLRPGDVLLLENCRFHPGDEKNDEAMARALAGLCDVFVNDAFGAAHRAHASTVGVARFASVAACGFLMRKELEYLGRLLVGPEKPFIAILGGAKVSDKIGVMRHLVGRVDTFLIGGGMTYTFLRAQGFPTGRSRVEPDKLEVAREVVQACRERRVAFLLPPDHVIAERIEAGASHQTVVGPEIPEGWMGVDIGPMAREAFAQVIARARTVFWNGPMGVFELPPFAAGTRAVAQALGAASGTTVVGGGDSVAAVVRAGVADRITHLSTGGGASLEFLEGKELPGVACLADKG